MSDVLSTVPASAPKSGVSRRQLVKAGVWAAPAVAVAIAMPAAAASAALSIGGVSAPAPTKVSSTNRYVVTVSVSHVSKTPVNVTVTLSSADSALSFPSGPQTHSIGGGTTVYAFTPTMWVANQSGSQRTFTVTVSAPGHTSVAKTVTFANGSAFSA